ncbi:unnamed protein product [Urochloa decumbens]|uniref:BED-type domain-containing protein n=1 Tax=Urochloa decumbens TaxID=240449 RepID=A0ABC9FS89_9POAL
MEEVHVNANEGIGGQEEGSDSNPSPLYSDTKLNKRLRSKVWETFMPCFVDGKLARAECKHCHQVLKCIGTNGTGSLLRHQANCSTGTQKRSRQHEHTSLPDPKQQKLPFLSSSQKKCLGITDAFPAQRLAWPGACTNDKNTKNQEVGQNGSHDKFVVHEQKNLASHSIPADKSMENEAHGGIALSEQVIPTGTNGKNQEVKQNHSHEEIVRALSMHGHHPSMIGLDRFKELVAYLNPMVKTPSFFDLTVDSWKLFQEEESKLKKKLVALRNRVCLSAYVWHCNPRLAFLCLSVHYIDDEWEKQQKIIRFRAVDPSCNAKELSNIMLKAIEEWHLGGKVFSIILDDAFIDDTVALNVKASLQKWNKLAANHSLFVVRYATHLLDQVVQVGLDELDTYMEKSAKFSKHTMGSTGSVLQDSNCSYAPSKEDWKLAQRICGMLQGFHKHMDFTHNFPSPAIFFEKLWAVKKKVHLKASIYREPYFVSRKLEEAFSRVREKMQRKFRECWNGCFMHFFMPMAMDPNYRLKYVMSHLDVDTFDNDKEDYLQQVHDTLASLFNEYSNLKEPYSTSGAKTSKETIVDGDMLMDYYFHSKYPYSAGPLSELDQYLQEPCLTTGESSVLQWWKEHHLTYPTIARMALDILAVPCSTDCKEATRTARIAMTESASKHQVEQFVCVQDWLKPAGTMAVESMEDL